MKIAKNTSVFFLLLCGLWGYPLIGNSVDILFADEIIIIVNKSVAEDSLSSLDVKNIFLGKRKAWNNNKNIILAVQHDTDTHKRFTRKFLKKTHTQFNNYWKNMVFTGKGKVPKRFKDEEELKAFIASTDDAIGYISARFYTKEVKELTIVESEK